MARDFRQQNKAETRCLLCGELAVRSHILPRALIHDLRKGAGHVVVGKRDADGVRYSQSGEWEHLLCEQHESALSPADDYGVRFCRAAHASMDGASEYFTVPNPEPDLLLRFALANVWRKVHSASGKRLRLSLGSHELRVRQAIFDHHPSPYHLLLNSSSHSLEGQPINIASYPMQTRLLDIKMWKFSLSRIDFSIAISNQRITKYYSDFLSSQHDPAIITKLPLIDTEFLPNYAEVFRRMRRRSNPR